jgi:hypothetical protein
VRFLIKLILVVSLGVAAQWAIDRHRDELTDVWLGLRVLLSIATHDETGFDRLVEECTTPAHRAARWEFANPPSANAGLFDHTVRPPWRDPTPLPTTADPPTTRDGLATTDFGLVP